LPSLREVGRFVAVVLMTWMFMWLVVPYAMFWSKNLKDYEDFCGGEFW